MVHFSFHFVCCSLVHKVIPLLYTVHEPNCVSLHWIPVKQNQFKILLCAHKGLNVLVPPLLSGLFQLYQTLWTLRSADQFLLYVQRGLGFCCLGPILCYPLCKHQRKYFNQTLTQVPMVNSTLHLMPFNGPYFIHISQLIFNSSIKNTAVK